MEMISEDEGEVETREPTILIHALIGIQPPHCHTMQLRVDMNGACLLTLLDSSSTHNFIDTEVAMRVGLVLSEHGGLRVVVANGDHLTSLGCCKAMSFSISGEAFHIDCYGLALGSYEMVLRVQ
jgi:hypothetical protein